MTPSSVCPECGGSGLIASGECEVAMSGPTCRNPDCPPCQDPEQIDCPTCHGTGRLSTSEGETIARAFHAAYEDLAPRLLDAGVIAPASSNPVSSAPGPRVPDSETHSRIGSETPDERSEGSRIAAPVSREQDFDGRDRQVKGAGCDEPDHEGADRGEKRGGNATGLPSESSVSREGEERPRSGAFDDPRWVWIISESKVLEGPKWPVVWIASGEKLWVVPRARAEIAEHDRAEARSRAEAAEKRAEEAEAERDELATELTSAGHQREDYKLVIAELESARSRIQELEAQRDEAWRNAITHKERAGDLEERVLELEGVLERLTKAASPYLTRAAPHEQLFNGEDLRNFDRLSVAMQAALDSLRSTLSEQEGEGE